MGVPISEREAGKEAGLSDRQRKTAVAIANIPKEQFEKLIEGDKTPTLTQLAEVGRKSKPKPIIDIGDKNPKDIEACTKAHIGLSTMSRSIAGLDPASVVRGTFDSEKPRFRQWIKDIKQWLQRLEAVLGE